MAAQEGGDSPTHPKRVLTTTTQARGGTRSNTGSPMSEKHAAAAPLTPGRSRLRQVTLGDDTEAEESTVVPVFGEWDDNDPASAEGYSHIFNKVREEKHGGGGAKSPRVTSHDSSSFYGQRHDPKKGQGCGCFPWGKK